MVIWCINEGYYCQGNSAKLCESVLCLHKVISELQLQKWTTNQCSFLRCGPARNHHHRCSGTSLEGSGTSQTRRCSGNYTHRCLWERKKMLVMLPGWKKELKEDKNATGWVQHLDRPCCLLSEWSPSHTRSGIHPERSDTGRSHTGSRCLHTRPCLKQNTVHYKPTVHEAHCAHTVVSRFIEKVSAVLPEQENPSPLKPSLHVHL